MLVLSCAQIWFFYLFGWETVDYSSYLLINHCLIEYKQIKARIKSNCYVIDLVIVSYFLAILFYVVKYLGTFDLYTILTWFQES